MLFLIPLMLLFILQPRSAPMPSQTVHIVQLITAKPARCISIPTTAGLVIVLDQREITGIAKNRKEYWFSGDARMARLRARRAKIIIDNTSKYTDKLGCYVDNEALAGGYKAHEGFYLIFKIFRSKYGRIWSSNKGSFLSKAKIVNYNGHLSGWAALQSMAGIKLIDISVWVH